MDKNLLHNNLIQKIYELKKIINKEKIYNCILFKKIEKDKEKLFYFIEKNEFKINSIKSNSEEKIFLYQKKRLKIHIEFISKLQILREKIKKLPIKVF